ncbi:hypothetical protein ACROYT_G016641 [Oculina patagonica]
MFMVTVDVLHSLSSSCNNLKLLNTAWIEIREIRRITSSNVLIVNLEEIISRAPKTSEMDEFGSLRRFQSEDEDEALAKALEISQQESTATSTVSQHDGKQREDSRQPPHRNLEFHEDEELSRALALSLEMHNNKQERTGAMAVPLCLPNNCEWNPRTGKYVKTDAQRSSIYVVEDALELLRKVKGPVCVVSIAGPYRKGKSYILSAAFDQPDVFPLGHEMVAKTMGIWLWIIPKRFKNSNGQEFTVVLLDSEGIDSTTSEDLDDHRIFTLTVLLASVLIYNSQGVPTRTDVEKLEYPFPCVFKESDSPAADHQGQQVAESILRFFPGFDAFMLPPPTVDPETMRSINQKKSQVNPKFLSGLKQFKNSIRPTLSPKHSFNDGEFVTGEGLAALVQLYVEAINNPDAIPNVQRAWDTFVETKCVDAKQTALVTYDAFMTSQLSGQLPCNNTEIRKSHNASLEECEGQFVKELAGISTNTIEMATRELKVSVEKKLSSWLTENETQTRQFCKDLLGQLKRRHLDPVFQQLQGREAAKVSFDDIIGGYQRIKDDYHKSAKGAKDVIATVFVELHAELLKEKEQYLGLLRQLKDFDEELSRELAAKAYQEQERKRLEEQQSRLQQQNRQQKKEMEILIKNLDEERQRFSEQMKSERNAQRDQMENMMAASMKHAQEERRAFIRENQALQDRFLASQKRSEEHMKVIKHLSDVAAKQEKEKVELLQKMKDQAEADQEALIKKINEKHDEEMKAIRDEMNAKRDEAIRQAPPSETKAHGTTGLIDKRSRGADDLQKRIDKTHLQQQAVEKPGFCKRALKFVGRVVVPVVGTVVSAVVPVVAPIVAPVAAAASAVIEFVSDNICSIM